MQTVIAIVGKIGAGKDEAAEYLSKKLNWPVFKVSQPLKDELKRQGKEINRENLAKLGTEWSKKKGDDYLARLALKKHKGNLIICGPRQLGQINFLRQNSNLIILAINARDNIRFKRVIKRNSVKEAKNLQKFIEEEIKNDASDGANQVVKCIKLANIAVENNGSLDNLHRNLDKAIKKINLFDISV